MKNNFYCVIVNGLAYKYKDFETAKKEANKLVKKGYNVVIADRLYDDNNHIGTYCKYVKDKNGRWYVDADSMRGGYSKLAYVGMPVEMGIQPVYEDGRWGKLEIAYGNIETIDDCGQVYARLDDGRLLKSGFNDGCHMHFSSKYLPQPSTFCLYVKEKYESGNTVYSHGTNWKSYYTKEAALKDQNAMREGYRILASVNNTVNMKREVRSIQDGFVYEEFVKYHSDYERTKYVEVTVK